MGTVIRAEVSKKNKYWISKHRHYELKYFCLQYPMWKKAYESVQQEAIGLSRMDECISSNIPGDPTARCVDRKMYYLDRIKLIEDVAKETDEFLHSYILKAVTEELSFTYLKNKLNIPCGRDMYYDRYRKFFWLLSGSRE